MRVVRCRLRGLPLEFVTALAAELLGDSAASAARKRGGVVVRAERGGVAMSDERGGVDVRDAWVGDVVWEERGGVVMSDERGGVDVRGARGAAAAERCGARDDAPVLRDGVIAARAEAAGSRSVRRARFGGIVAVRDAGGTLDESRSRFRVNS